MPDGLEVCTWVVLTVYLCVAVDRMPQRLDWPDAALAVVDHHDHNFRQPLVEVHLDVRLVEDHALQKFIMNGIRLIAVKGLVLGRSTHDVQLGLRCRAGRDVGDAWEMQSDDEGTESCRGTRTYDRNKESRRVVTDSSVEAAVTGAAIRDSWQPALVTAIACYCKASREATEPRRNASMGIWEFVIYMLA